MYTFTFRQQIRCMFVGFSELHEVRSDLYFTLNLDTVAQKVFVNDLQSANQRIEKFFGKKTSTPVIIAGNSEKFLKKYGSNTKAPGVCHNTFHRTYIVLGKSGLNVDVISHELVHAELIQQIGWFKKEYEIPTWFDEGLAMLVDERYDSLADNIWFRLTASGTIVPRLKQMENMQGFMEVSQISPYLSYVTSKNEVKRWWNIVGQEGFKDFIEEIKKGTSFQDAYQKIESKYGETQVK